MKTITTTKYLKTAINLARMYGVAETLTPLGCKSEEEFQKTIFAWTSEYLKQKDMCLVKFFEQKIDECSYENT